MLARIRPGTAVSLSGTAILLATFVLVHGEQSTRTSGTIDILPAPTGTHWTYHGSSGPANWAGLDPAFAACGTGQNQSPIDIRCNDTITAGLPAINFSYFPTEWACKNNGHTMELEYDPGSMISVGNLSYELLQFHFHTPSEHTFEGGAHYPLELHAVHQNSFGELAVVGIMIKPGAHNNAWPSELAQIAAHGELTEVRFASIDINMMDFLPSNQAYYLYAGSLTTPPCSEGVTWIVMKDPIEMSQEQIDVIAGIINRLPDSDDRGNNNRPTQPLNGRIIYRGN